LVLALPIALAALGFALSVATTVMGEMAKGSPRFYTAALSFTYLMACVIFLPAYTGAYGWFWWRTKAQGADIVKSLWLMPLVASALIWFPSLLLPHESAVSKLQLYFFLVAGTLLVGYAWVAVARLILYFWRK